VLVRTVCTADETGDIFLLEDYILDVTAYHNHGTSRRHQSLLVSLLFSHFEWSAAFLNGNGQLLPTGLTPFPLIAQRKYRVFLQPQAREYEKEDCLTPQKKLGGGGRGES
jgi:hypothetical protein